MANTVSATAAAMEGRKAFKDLYELREDLGKYVRCVSLLINRELLILVWCECIINLQKIWRVMCRDLSVDVCIGREICTIVRPWLLHEYNPCCVKITL